MEDTRKSLLRHYSFFDLHLSRLKCLCSLVLGLIQIRRVTLNELALSFEGSASQDSVTKRISRFLSSLVFPYDAMSHYIWSRFQTEEETLLSLDRTNWKFGQLNINILMLSICYRGYGIPLMWTLLDKGGNSSQEERIELIKRFLTLIKTDQIVRLVADREFIGAKWLNWLDEHHIHYIIRIRANQYLESEKGKAQHAHALFAAHSWKRLRKARKLKGVWVFVGGQRLSSGDYLILVSNLPLQRGKYYYAKRWDIEILFGALKTRGFNFEDTHLVDYQRIEALIGLLGLAFAWAVLVGDWISQGGKTIPIKNHGRKAKSIFRTGLDFIRRKLLNNRPLTDQLKLLSGT